MFENISANGTTLSLTVAPELAFSNPAMAFSNPASSLSLPHVVKVSSSLPEVSAGRENPQAVSSRAVSNDPITDIRNGWDLHVDLGLDNPALYGLIYSDPHGTEIRPALATVARGLQRTVKRIAEIGRLGMSEERATHLVHAANRGLVLTLMSLPEDQRDRTLSDTARDSVIATIITDHPSQAPSRAIAAAATLRAVLGQFTALTPLECELLGEWLDRIADSTD